MPLYAVSLVREEFEEYTPKVCNLFKIATRAKALNQTNLPFPACWVLVSALE